MKKPYPAPETTVVAVEPVKMISQSSGTPNPPVKPEDNTGDSFSRPVIPSDDLWEE